jgi:hypothetical protein
VLATARPMVHSVQYGGNFEIDIDRLLFRGVAPGHFARVLTARKRGLAKEMHQVP